MNQNSTTTGSALKVIPGNTPVKVQNTTQAPYCYVGLLSMTFPNGEEYIGTATVIPEAGKDESQYLLTCAHNLYDQADGGEVSVVVFQRAYSHPEDPRQQTQDPFLPVAAESWHYPAGYPAVAISRATDLGLIGETEMKANVDLDYAVIKLKVPIAIKDCNLLTVASDAVLQGMDVQINGYGIYDEEMSHAAGEITVVKPTHLQYPISTAKGASGSAILSQDNKHIVGIHTRSSAKNALNKGVRITAGVKAQIEKWMQS